jgi:hypothetical protein
MVAYAAEWATDGCGALLLDVVRNTPVAEPANEPWPGGNTAQLHSLGVVVTNIRERVRAWTQEHQHADSGASSTGIGIRLAGRSGRST